MDFVDQPSAFLTVLVVFLLIFFDSNRFLVLSPSTENSDDDDFQLDGLREVEFNSSTDFDILTSTTLHSLHFLTSLQLLDDDLGYWVKPRSTTWFSKFLLEQYSDERWIELFRITRASVFALADVLKPSVTKKDTKYRRTIPTLIRTACTLFKLCHGASLVLCSEIFVVGCSSVSMMLREVVYAINNTLRGEIRWPQGEELLQTEQDFCNVCRVPGIVGAIDGTHIAISKPRFARADYYYFKSGGYNIHYQAVVSSDTRFIDLFIGMPGSINDSRVLQRSTLHQKAMSSSLWDAGLNFHSFRPYLLGDAGYPLLPWLMVPHSEVGALTLADSCFNRRLRRGRGIVENSFTMLKQIFQELLNKTELDIDFVPDVIVACAILHNVLQAQNSADVERYLETLQHPHCNMNAPPEASAFRRLKAATDRTAAEVGLAKRRDLGEYLVLQSRGHLH